LRWHTTCEQERFRDVCDTTDKSVGLITKTRPMSTARESPLPFAQSSSSTPRRPSVSSSHTPQVPDATPPRFSASSTACRPATSIRSPLLLTGSLVTTSLFTHRSRPRMRRLSSRISESSNHISGSHLCRKLCSYEIFSRRALTLNLARRRPPRLRRNQDPRTHTSSRASPRDSREDCGEGRWTRLDINKAWYIGQYTIKCENENGIIMIMEFVYLRVLFRSCF
jgi:hypothetical protein